MSSVEHLHTEVRMLQVKEHNKLLSDVIDIEQYAYQTSDATRFGSHSQWANNILTDPILLK